MENKIYQTSKGWSTGVIDKRKFCDEFEYKGFIIRVFALDEMCVYCSKTLHIEYETHSIIDARRYIDEIYVKYVKPSSYRD